jgi:hypothetical protein
LGNKAAAAGQGRSGGGRYKGEFGWRYVKKGNERAAEVEFGIWQGEESGTGILRNRADPRRGVKIPNKSFLCTEVAIYVPGSDDHDGAGVL